MDNSKNSLTSGARGELLIIKSPEPHLTHRPGHASRPAPRRHRRVALAGAAFALLGLLALPSPASAQDTTPPSLISATLIESLGVIELTFSEALDAPPLGFHGPMSILYYDALVRQFSVTEEGNAATLQMPYNHQRPGERKISLRPTPAIRRGSAVVISYTDPTAPGTFAGYTVALQDAADNRTPSFITGMNGVPAFANSSTRAPTAPGATASLRAAGGSGRINLRWNAPVDNGGRAITGYKIEVSSDSGTTWTNLVANTGSAATTYAHINLPDGATRHYRVSAINAVGTGTASNPDGATTEGVSTPTASDGRVTARENQDYTFTAADFNYADSNVNPLASVTIKVRPDSGALKLDNARVRVDAAVTRAQLDAGSLTYTPPTDQTGTGVAFFYFAVSDGIAESTSVYRMTIDIAADTVAPGRPRNLTAVPGNGAVALRWEAPLSPGSSAIVRYEVRHAAGGAVPPATAWESVGLTFTHTVTGLADGRTRSRCGR